MRRDVRVPLLASLACIGAVGALAWAAADFDPLRRFDLRTVLHFEQGAAGADPIANVLVHLGDPASLLGLSVVILVLGLHCRRRREVVAALVVIAGANLTTQVLKVVFEGSRHVFYEPRFDPSGTNGFPSRDSFPSGHTTAAASIAVAALFVVPTLHRMTTAAAGLLLTAAVGISVLVLDWHYPSDVLGGLLVVAAWGFAVLAALRASSSDHEASEVRRELSRATIGG